MNIALIGTGNVGRALAQRLARAGHFVRIGIREVLNFKSGDLLSFSSLISVHPRTEAVAGAEVVVVAAVPQATLQIVQSLGDTTGKVIIDAMTLARTDTDIDGYPTSTHALLDLTGNPDVVKCFNTTGYENLLDPVYHGQGIDMFTAGDSARGKAVATQLALDCGFGACYDFGGNDKLELLESLALCWANLTITQGHERGLAFRVVRR